MTVGAVVPAAGRGTRYARSESKLFTRIGGRSVLRRSVESLDAHEGVADVVVVAAGNELDLVERELAGVAKVAGIVVGGPTRCDSVRAGLNALPERVDTVLVHDAARPAVTPAVIDAVIAGVVRWGAAIPGVPVADTVKRTDADGLIQETVLRERLWLVQTPQGARRSILESAYRSLDPAAEPPTDEAGLLERAGFPVAVVEGDPENVKLTTVADLNRLEGALAAHERIGPDGMGRDGGDGIPPYRTGFGYDVHRLAEGVPLWLGGVRVPHSHGLIGHSDADVVMHAVCDALLGSVGAPDIGTWFPNTDECNRGRASREFVAQAASVVRREGYEIGNIDIAIQAERPRIGPYREAMRQAIAAAAAIPVGRIGLKATTNERLGFVGREEGIGCWAVASVYRTAQSGPSDQAAMGRPFRA